MLTDTNLQNASTEFLQGLVSQCTRVLDNEDDPRTPDARAKIAAFRDKLTGVLDVRLARK